MRTPVITALTVFMMCPRVGVSAQTTPGPTPVKTPIHDDEHATPRKPAPLPGFTGSWRSAPSETSLSSDLDRSVWGPNASSVRNVSLAVRPSGEATLTVTTRVVDARGQTIRGSTAIEEARIIIGEAQETAGPRTDHAVKVVSAERRYPNDPGYRWQIEGLRVKVTSLNDRGGDAIEIRFDTPEGRGSFWETLTRQRQR